MEPDSQLVKCSDSGEPRQLARIELFVFLTFLLLLCLHLVARLRRCCRSTVLKVLDLVSNAAILALIPYIFSMMNNLGHKNDLVSVWAVYLLYVYVNVPSFVSFNDSLSIGVAYVKICLYGYYIFVIYTGSVREDSKVCGHSIRLRGLSRLQAVIGGFTVLRALEILIARAMLVYDGAVRLRVKDHHGNMSVPTSTSSGDPWLRCNYDIPRGKTIREIWGIEDDEGCVVSSSWELKSCCISLALLWRLVRVFNGRSSFQSSSDQKEAWNLTRNGLLDCRNICPFKVIELELEVLHPYIYNSSSFFLAKFGASYILPMHIARFVAITWMGVSTVKQYHAKDMSSIWIGVLLTWMVVIASAVVELIQFIGFWFSLWQFMLMLCDYLAKEEWKTEDQDVVERGMTKDTEELLLSVVPLLIKLLLKPWIQLGQYSLLDDYSFLKHFRHFLTTINALTGNRFVRPGRRESKSVFLTSEIKEALIKALLDRGPQLTNGVATLKASNKLSPETKTKLVWGCTQVHTKAHLVLIWHIATSLCELKQEGSPSSGGDFNVATSLSKYCAYLVAFAPDLLPDIVASTNYTCNVAILEACSCLKSCEASMIYDKLMEIAVEDDDSRTSILKQGAVLGKILVEEVANQDERWEVLAGFWAELILYLAPNDHNEWAHVERLADRGEFITHLWALLYHAGFVDRDSLSNHPARDADANHPSELGHV